MRCPRMAWNPKSSPKVPLQMLSYRNARRGRAGNFDLGPLATSHRGRTHHSMPERVSGKPSGNPAGATVGPG